MANISTIPRTLLAAVKQLIDREPGLPTVLSFEVSDLADDGELIAAVVISSVAEQQVRFAIEAIARSLFRIGGPLFDISCEDIETTARRDRDPGGVATTLLFANGLHNLLAYRLTNAIWRKGECATAMAIKSHFSRSLGADIMPQAEIGRRVWIDHGLGIVIGQEAVIEDDVSIWHGVTLGSSFNNRDQRRHPKLCRGAVVGADAQIIGAIEIGEQAVVAAGTTVTKSVPSHTTIVGARPRIIERTRSSFSGFDQVLTR